MSSNDNLRRRRGQALVEFALIALVLVLILAVTMDLGRAIFSAQTSEQAVDVAARELARTPLPASGFTLQQLLDGDSTVPPDALAQVRKVYDPDWLVFDLTRVPGDTTVPEYFAAHNAPLLNQLLLPIMIYDDVLQAETGQRVFRFPGVINFAADASRPSGFHVTKAAFVRVTYGADGSESIDTTNLIPVVEEIKFGGDGHSAFPIDSPEGGLVALRINYPFQAAAMSNFGQSPNGRFEPNVEEITEVSDGTTAPHGVPATYAGPNDLGQQYALGKTVRPYRRVLSLQAIHRRELFVP